MAVYYIGSYDIDDAEAFRRYPPVVLALLPKYGGQVLASDTAAHVIEGRSKTMNAIIRFPSREAALGLYQDPDYQEAKRLRQRSTSNCTMVIVEEYGPSGSGLPSTARMTIRGFVATIVARLLRRPAHPVAG